MSERPANFGIHVFPLRESGKRFDGSRGGNHARILNLMLAFAEHTPTVLLQRALERWLKNRTR